MATMTAIRLEHGDFARGVERIERKDVPEPPEGAIVHPYRKGDDKVVDFQQGDDIRRWRYRRGELVVYIEYDADHARRSEERDKAMRRAPANWSRHKRLQTYPPVPGHPWKRCWVA